MFGSGGRVARLHEWVDPIGMAAMVIVAGKAIVSIRVNPLDPATVTFAFVNRGTANNAIPEEVILTGTIRTR